MTETTEIITTGITLAKGISDYGMLVIAGSFFIIVAIIMYITLIKTNKRIVDIVIDNLSKSLGDISPTLESVKNNIIENKESNENINNTLLNVERYLKSLTEYSLNIYTSTIKQIVEDNFDLSAERVINSIFIIKVENHIHEHRQEIEEKLMRMLRSIYQRRATLFNSLKYNNKYLSSFIDNSSINTIFKSAIDEIYSDHKDSVIELNIRTLYEELKNDFINRMMDK